MLRFENHVYYKCVNKVLLIILHRPVYLLFSCFFWCNAWVHCNNISCKLKIKTTVPVNIIRTRSICVFGTGLWPVACVPIHNCSTSTKFYICTWIGGGDYNMIIKYSWLQYRYSNHKTYIIHNFIYYGLIVITYKYLFLNLNLFICLP